MCQVKPGPRCTPHTATAARAAMQAYQETYPDGPAVDPLAAAVGQAEGTDEYGLPLYGRQLREQGHQLMQRLHAARTEAQRQEVMSEIREHNENVASFEANLREANQDMAAFTSDPHCDEWTRRECLAQIARNELDLRQLTLAA